MKTKLLTLALVLGALTVSQQASADFTLRHVDGAGRVMGHSAVDTYPLGTYNSGGRTNAFVLPYATPAWSGYYNYSWY